MDDTQTQTPELLDNDGAPIPAQPEPVQLTLEIDNGQIGHESEV